MQISNDDLQSFYALLTPRIQADLSSWYGDNARLIGEPTFHPRPWSYFFRYRVQIGDSKEQGVLAKIRHIEDMSISQAVQDEKMREEMKDEFDSLVMIREIFTQSNNVERFATIRELAFYEDLNILIMEEADIQTLKSRFQKPSMWVEGKSRKIFDRYLESTGRWLRIFHDSVGDAQDGPFFSESLYQKIGVYLQRIQSRSGKDVKFLQSSVDALYKQYKDRVIPYGITHDNFSLANVFITGEEKICSFDPHNKPGAIYLDLAKLITDMETCFVQLISYGMRILPARLEKFNASFLHGYFQSEPVDVSALNLYRLILLIEKWDETEEKIAEATGIRKVIYVVAAIPLRFFYISRIRRRMMSFEK